MDKERSDKETVGNTKDKREQDNSDLGKFGFDYNFDYKDTSKNAETKSVPKGLDYFVCGQFEFDMFKGTKGTIVKEITLCVSLSPPEFKYSNNPTAKKSTEFGKRTCAPVRGSLYVEIEPSESTDTAKPSKTPLEASSNIAVTANIDTPLLATIGKPSFKTTIELKLSGEFSKFKGGLEWGCVGNSVEIDHSNSAGVKVKLNFSNTAPQKLY